MQYPSEQDEDGKYYSGYDNQVHEGNSYTSYSVWVRRFCWVLRASLTSIQDTFRAEWAWQILLAPERIPGMVQSMLQDYKEGGWLPMWKNIVGASLFKFVFVTNATLKS